MPRLPRLVVLPALFALLLGLVPSSAQAPAGTKRALLVGVNEYDHGDLPKLRYAVNDVATLRDVLKSKGGYDVVLLTADEGRRDERLLPTKANVEARLSELVRRFKKGDTLLIGLAGHGVQFEQDDDGYFCPLDARPLAKRKDTLVSIKWVYERLKEDAAEGTKLVVVDACRNDPTPGRGRGIDADTAPPPPKGVGVLLSCSSGQKAMESDAHKHGVFFHHLIEGLKGEATDRRGNVTWDSLRSHVKEQVTLEVPKVFAGREQTPEESGRLAGLSPVLLTPPATSAKSPSPRPTIDSSATSDDKTFMSPTIGAKFVRVPKGESLLGGGGGKAGTKKFTLEQDILIGQFEVTQGQWKAVMDGKNPSHFKEHPGADDLPVENVSYDMIQEFLRRLNAKEEKTLGGRKYRLPTEEEWEYSYRGGPISEEESSYHFYFGKPTNDLSAVDANFDGNYPVGAGTKGAIGAFLNRTCKVGSYQANKLGIYDMSGNVWEWTDSLEGLDRVIRGGSWGSHGSDCQASNRYGNDPSRAFAARGFRLVLVPVRRPD